LNYAKHAKESGMEIPEEPVIFFNDIKRSLEMSNNSPEKLVKAIHRRTRRKYSAEEKIRIVLQGLRGEDSIAELCRREGLNQNVYYRWSKEFLEAGKQRLSGNTQREATSDEVVELRKENNQLKQVLADTVLKNTVLKKSVLGSGSMWDEE
jgi:transposase